MLNGRAFAAAFAGAAGAELARHRELPHHRRGGVGIEPDLAAVDFADALHDELRRGLLEDDAGAAEFHGLDEFVLIFGGGEHDHFDALVELGDGLERGEAVQVGHAEVEQEHVGVEFLNAVEDFAAVVGLAYDVEILLQAEQLAEAIPDDGVVIGDQNSDSGLFRFHRSGV